MYIVSVAYKNANNNSGSGTIPGARRSLGPPPPPPLPPPSPSSGYFDLARAGDVQQYARRRALFLFPFYEWLALALPSDTPTTRNFSLTGRPPVPSNNIRLKLATVAVFFFFFIHLIQFWSLRKLAV